MTQDGDQPASGAPDHGRTLEFGFFLDPAAKAPAAVVDTAGLLDRLGYDLLDRLGYDLIGIQDHPYQAAHLDTQSLLGVILAQTSRVSFTRQPTRAFDTDGDITGPPEPWSDVLTHFALDVGFDTFILGGDNDERTVTTFITDVAPAVRQRVADARALSPRDALTEQRQLT
jgi:hypothetical protein